MGFPISEAILLEAAIIQSHEMAEMAPSLLFVIASFGGLFTCVVLCLICSECYSRFRNRQTYDGIDQSSSGEPELPVVQQIPRNIPSVPRDIPSAPQSHARARREMGRGRRIRNPNPLYDEVVSEFEGRILAEVHRIRQERIRRASRSTTRARNARSPILQQVEIESGRPGTPHPRPALQVHDLVPPVRIINTPPPLFDQVRSESAQYGLPEPNPNFRTMPQILEEVRQRIRAEDSQPMQSRQIPVGAGPPPPSSDQNVRESNRRPEVRLHRSQSDRTRQPAGRAILGRNPSLDQAVIGADRRATSRPHQSAMQEFQAEGSISVAEEAILLELALTSDQIENNPLPDYSIYSVISNESYASDDDPYLRRMNELGPPPLEGMSYNLPSPPSPPYVPGSPTPPPVYAGKWFPLCIAATPIEDSPTWARYRPPFLRVPRPPTPPSPPQVSVEEQLQLHESTSSKRDESDGRTGIESSIEAKGAVGGLFKTKGDISIDKEHGAILETKGETAKSDTERVTPQSKSETLTTEMLGAIPKAQGVTSRTETEWAQPETEGGQSRTDTEGVQPKSRGATPKTERDLPKPVVAGASTEIKGPMPETSSSRTRSDRERAMAESTTAESEMEWIVLTAEGATASADTGASISGLKDLRLRNLTESSDSTGNLETVDARPEVRSKNVKKKRPTIKRKRKSKK